MHLRLKMMFVSYSAYSCVWALCDSTLAQTALPQVDVTVASPITRRVPARQTAAPLTRCLEFRSFTAFSMLPDQVTARR